MIVAAFHTQSALQHAVGRLREAGITVETRTPVALAGESRASRLPLYAAIAGFLGAGVGFALQCYATMASYPLLIGGRPNFFWTSFLVYAFECGVLAVTLTCFVGFLIACRMPALYEPEDECAALRDATRAGWFALLRDPDDRARALLRDTKPAGTQEVRP